MRFGSIRKIRSAGPLLLAAVLALVGAAGCDKVFVGAGNPADSPIAGPGAGIGGGDGKGRLRIDNLHDNPRHSFIGCAGGTHCGGVSPDGCSCTVGCVQTDDTSNPDRCCADFERTCVLGRAQGAFMDPCPAQAPTETCSQAGPNPLFCQQYGRRGSFCTRHCEVDSDCPAPARGCNQHTVKFCAGPLLDNGL